MTIRVSTERIISENSVLFRNINLRSVEGGEDTNPLWASEVGNKEFKGALKNSLANHALLADPGKGRFDLSANLLHMDKPLMGFSLTVKSKVRYQLKKQSSNKAVLSNDVSASYTAALSDALVGSTRYRLAIEGSIRNNIQNFIKLLISRAKNLAERPAAPEQIQVRQNKSVDISQR